MQLLSTINQRVARGALALTFVLLLGLASVAMANAAGPNVLPVEPDGGIGGQVAEDLPLPVEPDGGIGN